MDKLKSIEDLERVRGEAQRVFKARTATGTTIIVGMGTCGIAAGARETLSAIAEELEARGIEATIKAGEVTKAQPTE